MSRVTRCPECGGSTTLVGTTNTWESEIVHDRICSECPTQYTVSYGEPVITGVVNLDG